MLGKADLYRVFYGLALNFRHAMQLADESDGFCSRFSVFMRKQACRRCLQSVVHL